MARSLQFSELFHLPNRNGNHHAPHLSVYYEDEVIVVREDLEK
jgi:hypothetical protein